MPDRGEPPSHLPSTHGNGAERQAPWISSHRRFSSFRRSAYTRPPHGTPRGTRARLPPRPARSGARVRGDVRDVARCRRVHRRLRRGRDRGALRGPPPADVVPAAGAADVAHVPPAPAAVPARGRVVRPARLRHRDLVLERLGARRAGRSRRGARLLLPQPVPVRVDRARGDAPGAPPARPAGAARAAQPLADVGLDRRPAGRPLRGELAADRGAHPALLRARLDRPLPARRHRSLPPGRRRVRSLHRSWRS